EPGGNGHASSTWFAALLIHFSIRYALPCLRNDDFVGPHRPRSAHFRRSGEHGGHVTRDFFCLSRPVDASFGWPWQVVVWDAESWLAAGLGRHDFLRDHRAMV